MEWIFSSIHLHTFLFPPGAQQNTMKKVNSHHVEKDEIREFNESPERTVNVNINIYNK